jgi:menaquinone-dependent protoporphyrinogen oxidase
MRVLVAASSRHGATGEIASEIGRVLTEHDLDVRIASLDDVADVHGFDAFVLGSAVYVGRWLGPARAFVDQHAGELAARPTWLFSSGPIGDPPKPVGDAAVNDDSLVEATGASEHRLFTGGSTGAGSGSASEPWCASSEPPRATTATGTTSGNGPARSRPRSPPRHSAPG